MEFAATIVWCFKSDLFPCLDLLGVACNHTINTSLANAREFEQGDTLVFLPGGILHKPLYSQKLLQEAVKNVLL